MMLLSRMLRLIQSCDNEGRSSVTDTILQAWEHQPGSARLLRASSNFIFTFHNDHPIGKERLILRFVPVEQRSAITIQAELVFIQHAIQQGVHANQPIPSVNGRLVETVTTGAGDFHAVVFERLPGDHLEIESLPAEQFSAWGRALAELHNASSGARPVARPGWQDLLHEAEGWLLPDDRLARTALDVVRNRLEKLPVTAENCGLIHFDFELDNLLWENGCPRPGIIDFDDCLYAWYAADIAYALRDLFDDRPSRVDLNHPGLLSFLDGYQQARPLPVEELANLPLFVRLLNLHKYAQLGRITSEGALPGEPEWATRLRRRLEAMRAKYREEFSLQP
jgi:Ser/Thr protein kinase RdoA (MazF antagonist)